MFRSCIPIFDNAHISKTACFLQLRSLLFPASPSHPQPFPRLPRPTNKKPKKAPSLVPVALGSQWATWREKHGPWSIFFTTGLLSTTNICGCLSTMLLSTIDCISLGNILVSTKQQTHSTYRTYFFLFWKKHIPIFGQISLVTPSPILVGQVLIFLVNRIFQAVQAIMIHNKPVKYLILWSSSWFIKFFSPMSSCFINHQLL